MYYELWNLLSVYIYGADAILTSDQTLTLTVLCTAGALFVVSLPFVLVWQVTKIFR